jgi:hypothetical protein
MVHKVTDNDYVYISWVGKQLRFVAHPITEIKCNFLPSEYSHTPAAPPRQADGGDPSRVWVPENTSSVTVIIVQCSR